MKHADDMYITFNGASMTKGCTAVLCVDTCAIKLFVRSERAVPVKKFTNRTCSAVVSIIACKTFPA